MPAPGFTLVEMAIVMLIIGILTTGVLSVVLPAIREARMMETQAKLDKIGRAIDFYVLQNNRLPCPAVPDVATANPPFGYQFGSGAAGDTVPNDCGATAAGGLWVGIVPFKTLGIPVDWVTDSAQKYISYAISPGFAYTPNDATRRVHQRCRTADWYSADIVYELPPGPNKPPVLVHKNPAKARFCCSAELIPNDLVVLDRNGVSMVQTVQGGVTITTRDATAANYDLTGISYPNPLQANVQVAANLRLTAPVYILVSHGEHGGGSYNTATGLRFPFLNATPAEITNAGGGVNTRTFYDIPPSDRTNAGGANEMNYDDEVLWRTQYTIFSNEGQTCSLP